MNSTAPNAVCYNDKFFGYEPVSIGVVFFLEDFRNLNSARNAVISLLSTLDDFEDRAYLFSQENRTDLPLSLGVTVADISNYKNNGLFNLQHILSYTASMISEASDRQYLLFFADGLQDNQVRRFERALKCGMNPDLVVIDMSSDSKLKHLYEQEGIIFHQATSSELTGDLLKESINGKN